MSICVSPLISATGNNTIDSLRKRQFILTHLAVIVILYLIVGSSVPSMPRSQCHICRRRCGPIFAPIPPPPPPIVIFPPAEILRDPYSKKSPLPSIGTPPRLTASPKDTSYRVLGQSRIHHRHITRNNHTRILAQ